MSPNSIKAYRDTFKLFLPFAVRGKSLWNQGRIALRWKIIGKETIDEIIFRTTKVRYRLILELMARGGMRIGEVLKLGLGDLQDPKLVLREPKSGKKMSLFFIPQKLADRLREYALEVCSAPSDRIFPISYEAARMMVINSDKLVGVKLRPHDLRKHAAACGLSFFEKYRSHPQGITFSRLVQSSVFWYR